MVASQAHRPQPAGDEQAGRSHQRRRQGRPGMGWAADEVGGGQEGDEGEGDDAGDEELKGLKRM